MKNKIDKVLPHQRKEKYLPPVHSMYHLPMFLTLKFYVMQKKSIGFS